MPRRCRPGGLRVAAAALAVILALFASGRAAPPGRSDGIPAPAPPAPGARDLERSADAEASRARECYQRAALAWRDVAREASAVADAAAARRALEARASLAALRLDAEGFLRLTSELGARLDAAGRAIGPRPVAATAETAASVAPGAFDAMTRLLSNASRRYRELADAEARDLPLIAEALALVHALEGDVHQARADAGYRAALARLGPLEAAGGEAPDGASPAAMAAAARLSYKLREFAAARRLAERLDDSRLGGETRCDHLRVAVALARLAGDDRGARVLRARLRDACLKEEEPARPDPRLGSVLLGSRADILLAVNFFVTALEVFRLPARDEVIAAYFGALGALELGEYALAEALIRGRAAAPLGDPWLEASVLARLAHSRDRLGDYESALLAVRAARARASTLSDAGAFLARADIQEGRILLGLGKPLEALRIARELLARGDLPAVLRVNGRLLAGGALYEMARGEPVRLDDARQAFAAAEREASELEEAKVDGAAEAVIRASINLGNVLRREALAADPRRAAALRKQAVERQDRAMRRAYDRGAHALAAVASSNLGELHLESGDLEAARGFIEWALARAQERRQFETLWRCRWYLGRIAAASGDEEAAERELRLALELVESYRDRVLDAEAKSGFMADKMDLFRFLVRREIARGDFERALELAERGRARALVESIGWRYVALSSERETRLYREYLDLVARESDARRRRDRALLGVAAAPADLDALRRDLDARRREILAASGTSAALRALVGGSAVPVREIQRAVAPGTALLEYFDLGDAIAAFVVDRERVDALVLRAAPAEVAGIVRRFIASGASDAALAARLHGMLLAPLEGSLRARRWIIVPYGALYALPFEALRGPDGLVVERREVIYLPSASLIDLLSRRRAPGVAVGERSLLALADPDTDYDGDGLRDKVALDGARKEVAALATSFAKPLVLEGKLATESMLRGEARGAGVLHIACHGEFHASRPWHSTLFLAPEGNEPEKDGLLRAYEVYGLDLRERRLVALSGCETGVQDIAGGDDPQGIATAFLHAGASSLLVSLWKVEDEATARLMQAFYRRWIDEDMDRAAALREAKLELLREGYDHPRQWASFVLVADG